MAVVEMAVGCGNGGKEKGRAQEARPVEEEWRARLPTAAQPASGSKGLSRASGNLGSAIDEHPCLERQHPPRDAGCQVTQTDFL